MDFDFDWLSNWRIVVNVALSAIVAGGLGSLVVYFAAPPETHFLSRVVLAGGFVPVIAAVQQRLAKRPSETARNGEPKS